MVREVMSVHNPYDKLRLMNNTQKHLLLALVVLGLSLNVNAAFRPQAGHWVIPNELGPGSGINLTTQGDTLGVSIFTYDESGRPTWFIAASQLTPVTNQFGLSFLPQVEFEAELVAATAGTPLGSEFSVSRIIPTGRTLKLEFTSTTTAQITLDGVSKPIRSLQFGRDLLQLPPLPLPAFTGAFPDVAGYWSVIARTPGVAGGVVQPIALRAAEEGDPQPAFDDIVYVNDQNRLDNMNTEFACRNVFNRIVVPDSFAFCALEYDASSPFETSSLLANNITQDRFDVVFEDRSQPIEERSEVFGLRIPDDISTLQPQSGHWQVVGETGAGSGVNLTVNGNLMAVSIFTYDTEGEAVWKIATGALDTETRSFQAPLQQASNGVPIMNDFSPAVLESTGQSLSIEFDRVGQAQLTIDDQTVTIRPLLFALDEISTSADPSSADALVFPDLSGDWVLVLEFNDDQPLITEPITFARTSMDDVQNSIQYAYSTFEGIVSQSTFACVESELTSICELTFELVQNNETVRYDLDVLTDSIGLDRLIADVNSNASPGSDPVFKRVFLLRTR